MENTPATNARSNRTAANNPTRTALVAFSLVIVSALAVFLLLKNAGRLDHLIGAHGDTTYTAKIPAHFNGSDAYAQTDINATPMMNNNWMNGIRGN